MSIRAKVSFVVGVAHSIGLTIDDPGSMDASITLKGRSKTSQADQDLVRWLFFAPPGEA